MSPAVALKVKCNYHYTGRWPNLAKYQISPMHALRRYIVIFLHMNFLKKEDASFWIILGK